MGDISVRLQGPIAANSLAGRLAADGSLNMHDMIRLAAQTGQTRPVGPGLVTNDLSRADLAAAGITDAGDQERLLTAYTVHLRALRDPISHEGFQPIAVTMPASRRPARASGSAAVAPSPTPAPAGNASYRAVADLLTPTERDTLLRLFSNGTLLKQDRSGKTALDHLARLATHQLVTPSAQDEARIARDLAPARQQAQAALDSWKQTNRPPYTAPQQGQLRALETDLARRTVSPFRLDQRQYRHEVVITLLRHLSDVNQVQQGGYGTCAPTIAQVQLLMQQPAEYARTVADLFTAGTARLLNGNAVPLQREGLVRVGHDNTGTSAARDWINMAFQSSLADDATPGTYSKVDENMQRQSELAGLRLSRPGRGLGPDARENLHEGMAGVDYRFIASESAAKAGNNGTAVARLRAELGDRRFDLSALMGGPAEPPANRFVPIRFNYGSAAKPESHAMAAIGQSATHLYIRNPQGNNFGFYQRRHLPVQTEPMATGSAGAGKRFIELDAASAAKWNKPAGLRVYEDGTEAVPWTTVDGHLWGVYVED